MLWYDTAQCNTISTEWYIIDNTSHFVFYTVFVPFHHFYHLWEKDDSKCFCPSSEFQTNKRIFCSITFWFMFIYPICAGSFHIIPHHDILSDIILFHITLNMRHFLADGKPIRVKKKKEGSCLNVNLGQNIKVKTCCSFWSRLAWFSAQRLVPYSVAFWVFCCFVDKLLIYSHKASSYISFGEVWLSEEWLE